MFWLYYMGSCVWSRPALWSSILPVSHRRWQWYFVAVDPKLPDHCQKIPLFGWLLHRSSSCILLGPTTNKNTNKFLYQLLLTSWTVISWYNWTDTETEINKPLDELAFLKSFPLACFSSSSLRTSLVPRQGAWLNLFTAWRKSLSSVSMPSKFCVARASALSTARYGPSGHPLILRALSHWGNMTCTQHTQTNIFP